MLYQLINHRPAKPARRAEDEGLAMGRRHQQSGLRVIFDYFPNIIEIDLHVQLYYSTVVKGKKRVK